MTQSQADTTRTATDKVRAALQEAAHHELPITLDHLAAAVGIDLSRRIGRKELDGLLMEVARDELEVKRPLLPLIAVDAETGRPPEVIVKLATHLGLIADVRDDHGIAAEWVRVFTHWSATASQTATGPATNARTAKGPGTCAACGGHGSLPCPTCGDTGCPLCLCDACGGSGNIAARPTCSCRTLTIT